LLAISSRRLQLALITVLVTALTAVTINYDIGRHQSTEEARLQTIADLKAGQIGDWLKERQSDADFLKTNRSVAENYRHWREHDDGASRLRLTEQLEQFRASKAYQRLLLLDAPGELRWDSATDAGTIDTTLLTAVRGAVTTPQNGTPAPYRDAGGQLHLDFVATLPGSEHHPGPTIILSSDPASYLFPILQTWPVPSASAEILLFRRDGEQVLYLNDLRHRTDSAASLHAPIATERLLAAQVLRGDARKGGLLNGEDYRAVAVLGVARTVPGTDWFLVAKLDRTEFFAEAWHDSLWIALAGLLTLIASVGGIFIVGQRYDLAETRRQGKQLAEYETIFNNALVGIVYLKQRHVISCNRRLEELFGYAPGELIGKSSEVFYDTRQTFDTIGVEAYRQGSEKWNFSTELLLKHKDGSLFHGTLNGCAIDPWHPQEGSIWIYTDISERYRTESALRESEELFRAVAQSANDAIVTADGSGQIVKWNWGAECIFGYTVTEIIGQPLTILMPQRFRDAHMTGMSRVRDGGKPHVMGAPVELSGLRKDGSEFPLELSLAQWRIPEGHFFTGVIRDISARKRIEQQLADQNEHLEELVEKRTVELSKALDAAKLADHAKDAFLANMSHELRTPLNAVIGMADLARSISTERAQCDYLDKIVASGKHLNSIINDLLDLSKIAAGHMELETITFSLSAMLAHCTSVMNYRAAEKGLQLIESIDDAVPDVLLGDPLRIEQIVLNLVSNAIKFTTTGSIKIRVSQHAREENRVCLDIDVEDTGIGMRPEDFERLFKPFSQADATVSRKFGGTGLGLSISKQLATMMDGDISVSSREGSGTTFKLRIWFCLGDAARMPGNITPAETALPVRYRDVHILAVDDQALNREIVEALLAAVGVTPRMAEDGQQAVDILTGAGPAAFDLILMDIQMPVMDGLTATRTLRSRAGFESLPIIAMTAHTMTHEKAISSEAGMNDHIGKPFDTANFYRTLAKWIPESKQVAGRVPAKFAAHVESQCIEDAVAGNNSDILHNVDFRNGLARFNNNEARYRHWLAEFLTSADTVSGKIRSEIASGHRDIAATTTHAFNGRVGMLGMDELHRVVSALEHALRNNDAVDTLLSVMEKTIAQTSGELTRFFDAKPP
jgi:PAS domain S-box-containing protein